MIPSALDPANDPRPRTSLVVLTVAAAVSSAGVAW